MSKLQYISLYILYFIITFLILGRSYNEIYFKKVNHFQKCTSANCKPDLLKISKQLIKITKHAWILALCKLIRFTVVTVHELLSTVKYKLRLYEYKWYFFNKLTVLNLIYFDHWRTKRITFLCAYDGQCGFFKRMWQLHPFRPKA